MVAATTASTAIATVATYIKVVDTAGAAARAHAIGQSQFRTLVMGIHCPHHSLKTRRLSGL